MTIALGNANAHGDVFSAANPTTGNINMSGSNLLLVHLACYLAGGTITDNQGNSPYAKLTLHNEASANRAQSQFHYFLNPTISSTTTFSATGSLYATISAAGFSGVDSYDGQENGAGSASSITSLAAAGSITPSANGALIASGVALGAGGWSSLTVDSGLSILDTESNGGVDGALAYLIQGIAGALTVGWSWTGAVTGVATSDAAFKATAGGGGGGFGTRSFGAIFG